MGAKLLVVDDDQGVRLVVEDTLVDAGYSVLQAEGGAQALVLLDEHPSIARDGQRCPYARRVRYCVGRKEAVRRRPDLRVILISGFIDQLRPVGRS